MLMMFCVVVVEFEFEFEVGGDEFKGCRPLGFLFSKLEL